MDDRLMTVNQFIAKSDHETWFRFKMQICAAGRLSDSRNYGKYGKLFSFSPEGLSEMICSKTGQK